MSHISEKSKTITATIQSDYQISYVSNKHTPNKLLRVNLNDFNTSKNWPNSSKEVGSWKEELSI